MLPHPCILRDPQQRGTKSEVDATPLPSRRAKRERKCYQQRGTKSEVVASPLPSWGAKKGQKCYIIPAFLGIPNAKRGEQNQKWSPTKANKILSGYLTPAFLGAQKRAHVLRHACILEEPQQRVTKSEGAASPLPSQGPKRGRKCCLTHAFSGIPNKA